MAQLGRPGLLSSQKAEAGEQWKRGKSLSDMGRALGKHAGSIHGIIAANGGIVPLPGRRSRPALTLAEREEISRRIAGGYPSDAWPLNLGGFLQRSVAKLSDMAGAVGIMPRWPMMRHGRTRVAPNPVGLPFIPSYSGPLLIN